MSPRRLQDVFKTCLQDAFSVTIFRLPRRLEDVLEDVKLLRWRRVEDVFKTCLQDVFKTCLQDVFKMSSRPTNVCWVGCFIMLRITNTLKEKTLVPNLAHLWPSFGLFLNAKKEVQTVQNFHQWFLLIDFYHNKFVN